MEQQGRFDEDTYARAKAFVEKGDKEDGEAKASSKSFGAAFKEAKAAGDATFTFNGKKYTTETKDEVTAKASKKSSTSDYGNEGKGKEYSPSVVSREEMNKRAEKQAIKPDTTIEETLLGGKAIKAAAGALRGAAKAATSKGGELATKYDEVTFLGRSGPKEAMKQIGEGQRKLGGPSSSASKAVEGPSGSPRLGGTAERARIGMEEAKKVAVEAPKKAAKPSGDSKELKKFNDELKKFKAKKEAPSSPKTTPKSKTDTRKWGEDKGIEFARGGMVKNAGIGASMKPHNVFGSKGKK